jgi:hypothetical protein
MSKTIIFISHRYINNYDFDISTTKNDRLVAIILDTCKHLFPEEKKKYFSKIYTIPQDDHSGPLIKFNYQNTKNVLLEELKNTDKSNLFLICIDEVNMILAGQLRDELELPGPKMEQLLKFQDKILMKKGLANTNIHLPVFIPFDPTIADANPEAYFNKLQKSLGKKFILKPTRYTGSFGTALINTFEDFMDFIHSKNHHKYEYEADQFIEGELYHCDIVLNKGKIIFSDCCKYSCPNLDFSFGKIIASLVLNPDSLIKQNLIETSLNSLSALGLTSGTFHVELFIDPVGKIYFLEVAARPAGGLVAFMYEKLIGINLFTLDLLISLDRDIPALEPSKTHCLQALVPIHTDTIEQFKKIIFQSKLTIEWLINADNIPKNTSKSVVDLAAKLLLTSNDYANFHSDFEKLSQCLPGKSQ